MIEYCSKRILTIALLTLVIIASIIFYVEESVNTSLRPPRPPFDIVVPCSEKQSFHFLTSCQRCSSIDRTIHKACKETGYHVQIVCDDVAEDKSKRPYVPTWVACDPNTFRDLNSERRSFVLFEFLIGTCGVMSYIFVRRQHKRLDQRLVDRLFKNESAGEINQNDTLGLYDSIYVAFHDGIASFQACACSLENAVVRITFGDTSNLAAITIHGLLMLRYAWKDACGSTCNPFNRYLHKRTNLRGLCLSWVFQLLGAFCALRLSYFWWSLRLSTPHDRLQTQRENILRLARFRDSKDFHKLGDLQVSFLFGIFVETAVAFSDVVISATTPALLNLWKHLQSDGKDIRFVEFVLFTVQQATGIYIIYLGLPLTGAYMNGVNAVIQTWGLGRASNPLCHIIVYWFSPLLGLWVGKRTLEVVHDSFTFWKSHLQIPMNGAPVPEIPVESEENSCPIRPNGLHSKSLMPRNQLSLRRSSKNDILSRTDQKSLTASNDSLMVDCGSSQSSLRKGNKKLGGELRQRCFRSRTQSGSVHL
ncbi:hypothetical protein ACTXT7_011508 [Hymenolepis weldensis]